MKTEIHKAIIALSTLFLAYCIYVLCAGAGYNFTGRHWDFEVSGQLGDSFGPLNTLMASVAALSAIAAYLSQRKELVRVSALAEAERVTADKRDFESTFFNLLNLLRETVREIDIPDRYGKDPVSGRDGLKRLLDTHLGRPSGSRQKDEESYRSTYSDFRDDLAHYFRTIYHILKYIDGSSVDDKMLYVRLLRATLSNAEIVLVALNCMYGGGKEKLKPLVENYSLLHNISASSSNRWNITTSFVASAFGERTIGQGGQLQEG